MNRSKLQQAYKKGLGLLAALGTLYGGDAFAQAGSLCGLSRTTDDFGVYTAIEDSAPHNGVPYGDAWVAFHNYHYNTPAEAWNHVGYRTTWGSPDMRGEFVKHVLSSLVIEHGVDFQQTEPQMVLWDGQLVDIANHDQRAFHSSEDYGAIARGRPPTKTFVSVRWEVGSEGNLRPAFRVTSAPWHLHSPLLVDENLEEPDLLGRWEYTWKTPWYTNIPVIGYFFGGKSSVSTVTTFCPLYSPKLVVGTTLNRAAVLVHEGWHSRNLPPMTDHVPGDPKKEDDDNECKREGRNCDVWYPHSKSAFGSGDTFFSRLPWGGGSPGGITSRPPLSAYQIGSEYLCDVADNARPWLPITAVIAAAVSAERLFSNKPFVNLPQPQYACGLPTPLYGWPVGSRTDECPSYGGGPGVRCDVDTDCPGGSGGIPTCVSGCCRATIVR